MRNRTRTLQYTLFYNTFYIVQTFSVCLNIRKLHTEVYLWNYTNTLLETEIVGSKNSDGKFKRE